MFENEFKKMLKGPGKPTEQNYQVYSGTGDALDCRGGERRGAARAGSRSKSLIHTMNKSLGDPLSPAPTWGAAPAPLSSTVVCSSPKKAKFGMVFSKCDVSRVGLQSCCAPNEGSQTKVTT